MNFFNVTDSIIKKKFSPIYLLHIKNLFYYEKYQKNLKKILYQKKINLLTRKFLIDSDINVEDLICEANPFNVR